MEPMVSSCRWGVWRWCCVSGRMWVIWSGGSKVCCLAVNEAFSLWHAEKREKKEGVPQGPSKVLVWSRRPLLCKHSPYRAAVDSLTHTSLSAHKDPKYLSFSLNWLSLSHTHIQKRWKATTLSHSFILLNTHTEYNPWLYFSLSPIHTGFLWTCPLDTHSPYGCALTHTSLLSRTLHLTETSQLYLDLRFVAFVSSAIQN